jgi:hypothetical protein
MAGLGSSSGLFQNATVSAVTTAAPGFTWQLDMTWVVSDLAIYACGVAMFISCVVCGWDMWQHVGRYEHPKLQAYTLRVLFMIPVYSVFSFVTLVFPETRFFLRTIRDCYEAFVLYQFLALLIEYCGGEAQLVQSLERKRYKGVHPAPMCFLPMFKLDRAFYVRCKRWVLQYALIKPLTAFIALATHPFGIYDETNLDFTSNVYAWCFLVCNFSISWSLWYLVVFHNEVERELHYCKPLLKFVCIKSIIFFSYWQTTALSIMLSMNMLYTGSTEEEQENVGQSIDEFLICLELLPICIMHHYGFGVAKLEEEMKEHPLYESASNVRRATTRLKRLDEALNLRQFFVDVVETVVARTNQLRHDIGDEHGGTNANNNDEEMVENAKSAASKQAHPIFSKIAWPQDATLQIEPTMVRVPMPAGVNPPQVDYAAELTETCNIVVPLESRAAPIPVELSTANPSATTGAALQLCNAVAAAHGGQSTTSEVFHAAVMLELNSRGTRNAALANADVDPYAGLSTSDEESAYDSEDDEARNEAAAKTAFSFGLKADDFAIVTKTATTINRAFQRVLFDEAATTTTRFCVVCGRSDREMVQRKSGLKCKECLGVKHNYQTGAEL